MTAINWNQKRQVVEATESGEHYVCVSGGFMLAQDYTQDGGRVENAVGPVTDVGVFTNAVLSGMY